MTKRFPTVKNANTHMLNISNTHTENNIGAPKKRNNFWWTVILLKSQRLSSYAPC